jgi:hypothetical protein
VGIGTTSPEVRLEARVDSSTTGTSGSPNISNILVLNRQGSTNGNFQGSALRFKSGSHYATIDAFHNDAGNTVMRFYTENATVIGERARITSGGYFKASNNGTYSNSTAPYHEFYQSSTDDVALLVRAANASQNQNVLQVTADRNTTNNTFYAINYFNVGASAFKFRVADSGDVTNTNNSYGSISDVKLKQDIVDAGSQWDDIKNLRVRKFRWKSDPDGFMQIGLVAQEAELVSPGLIDEHTDKTQETRTREVEKTREVEVTPAVLDEDGNVVEPAVMETETYIEEEEYTETVDLGTTTKSIKYSVLYMKAVKALQEAMERIETLEAKVAALEGN